MDGSLADILLFEGTEFSCPDTRLNCKKQCESVNVVSSPFFAGHTVPDFVPEDVNLFVREYLLVSFALSGITGLQILLVLDLRVRLLGDVVILGITGCGFMVAYDSRNTFCGDMLL